MQEGQEAEQRAAELEARRNFNRYEIQATRRRFDVHLQSEALRMSGVVDLVLELSDRTLEEALDRRQQTETMLFCPVEFKRSGRPIQDHQIAQLTAYMLLLEDLTAAPVHFGFIVSLPSGYVKRVEKSPDAVNQVTQTRRGILAMLRNNEIPPPTPHRAKCADCEFKRFCNDVW